MARSLSIKARMKIRNSRYKRRRQKVHHEAFIGLHGLQSGEEITDIAIDKVFIESWSTCTLKVCATLEKIVQSIK